MAVINEVINRNRRKSKPIVAIEWNWREAYPANTAVSHSHVVAGVNERRLHSQAT